MTPGDHVFIFGAGYCGRAFAAANRGGGARFSGTTRSPANFPALEAAGIEPLVFADWLRTPELDLRLAEVTHLVVSIGPDEAGDPVLDAAGAMLRTLPRLAWIGYLSTIGVYGDHNGAWVDEASPCRPVSARSLARIAAERAWLALGQEIGCPVSILRLSGIYGPGRNAFINLEQGSAKRLVKRGQVFNRIHVDDIAGALDHLASPGTQGIFNITDDLPAPPQDVVAYAADLMGVEPPPEVHFDTAQLSPMARSFYGENKRVSNGTLKRTGYRFRFPDYQTALSSMWTSGAWRGAGESDGRSKLRR